MTSVPELEQVEARLENWRRRLIDLSHRNRLIALQADEGDDADDRRADVARSARRSRPRAHRGTSTSRPSPRRGAETARATRRRPSTSYRRSERAPRTARAIERDRGHRAEPEAHRPHPRQPRQALEHRVPGQGAAHPLPRRRLSRLARPAARQGHLVAAGARAGRAAARVAAAPVPAALRRRRGHRHQPVADREAAARRGLDVPADWAWEDKPIEQELDEIRAGGRGTRLERARGRRARPVLVSEVRDVPRPARQRGAGRRSTRSSARWRPKRLLDEVRDGTRRCPTPTSSTTSSRRSRRCSILDADASQRRCIEAAKRGQSFVMQGPPGTGKSQTIANVIAEAIGQGKKVLFVSEKAAALDVVYNRLAGSGLDEYCLMLHGEHAGRREVVQALDRSLTSALRARPRDAAGRARPPREPAHAAQQLGRAAPRPPAAARRPVAARGARGARGAARRAICARARQNPRRLRAERGPRRTTTHSTEIFQRLSERWHVSPPDFAWRDYAATRLRCRRPWPVLAILRRLRRSLATPAQRAHGGRRASGCRAPDSRRTAQLAAVGAHLHGRTADRGAWLDRHPARSARPSRRGARRATARLPRRSRSFARAFPARALDDLDADAAERLATARDELRRRCGLDHGMGGCGWPAARAVAALARAPGTDRGRPPSARATAAQRLGQPDRVADPAADRRSSRELAELAFAAERPPRAGVARAGRPRPRQAGARRGRGDLVGYQEAVIALLRELHAGGARARRRRAASSASASATLVLREALRRLPPRREGAQGGAQ